MSSGSRSPGHGRKDDHGVAFTHGGVEKLEIANVAAVQVDVDEAVERAISAEELLAQSRVASHQIAQHLADGIPAGVDFLLIPDVNP
jgi:hypothetical protein